MNYQTLLYETDGPLAAITLNRPDELNSIVPPMPDELEQAVAQANGDKDVRVIVLRGAGRGFCAGFNFADNMAAWEGLVGADGSWDPGSDMIGVTSPHTGPVPKFMSMWRSPKPVIAQVQGWCVGGGSDMALCADLVIASDDARIGTPYSRAWGCYLTGMWIYRLGLTRAKEHALTGRPLSCKQAAEGGLINRAVPFADLEGTGMTEARALAARPPAQRAARKMVVNPAHAPMGLAGPTWLGPGLA
ncbi:MAG: crotonase/enoyl-CoA hydratase family protein, partial [Proteobacteria bacterium]|nr:crotonase/enoyl-CoA hydratase family protein [Pseudomonadota bacterium]